MDEAGTRAAAFETMSDVVLAVAAEPAVEPVLERLVHAARDLVGARYAALGLPDEDGTGFARFLTSGMSDELIDAIGPLPRAHGLLGAMLVDPAPYRTDDITADPRFAYFPAAHPRMGSFLGVPIVARGDVIGAFYLTDKEDGPRFTDDDQRLIELLAAHAAVAIENARLHELSHELTAAEERTRIARELHDSMSQTLFSLVLTAEAAAESVPSAPEEAVAQLRTVKQLAQATMTELRSLILGLRPAALETDGLAAALGSHVELLGRAHRQRIDLEVTGDRPVAAHVEREVFRVVQEALHNALRHAGADRITVTLDLGPSALRAEVRDDGAGFDPAARSVRARKLGLTSMRERARTVGGRLDLRSAPGQGTTVRLEVPDG